MLETVVNVVFWTLVAEAKDGLSESEQRYPRHVLKSLLSSATD